MISAIFNQLYALLSRASPDRLLPGIAMYIMYTIIFSPVLQTAVCYCIVVFYNNFPRERVQIHNEKRETPENIWFEIMKWFERRPPGGRRWRYSIGFILKEYIKIFSYNYHYYYYHHYHHYHYYYYYYYTKNVNSR